MPKVTADPQARIGGKGKKKSWYVEREYICVDVQLPLIHKVATTSANRPNAQSLHHIWPSPGAIERDKD
ncbi:MAG: hypothetical protein NPIRA03_00040 [Nitrospirales bacterium]|nr:MAG: hypothetical protein NPIRA03_00040 [Nitrospirales bacterium]